jgi:hypothetical protein
LLTALKSLDARLLGLCIRLADRLCDPARRNRAALTAALIYAAVWTLYAIVAKSSQGINADLGEMVVWARNLDWGYPKHPPLPGWILAAWFSVFPLADWAFHLLAGLNLGIGLYFTYLLCGLWLDSEKRAVAPFLLAVIPFYNFIGLKWDQNSILIPLWALTTWAFVRSLELRHAGYAALAGAAAAAAMLTKYWSAFLLLALIAAALIDRRRGAYLRSAAPGITVGVGAVLIAPHAVWLVHENFPPLQWVALRRTAGNVMDWLSSAVEYLAGAIAYAALALAAYAFFVRPSGAALRDTLLPRESGRRTAAVIFWLPLLVPLACATVTKTTLLSLWNTGSLGLLPVLLLSSPLVAVSRIAAARIIGSAIVVSALALVASPLVAAIKLRVGVENHALYVHDAVAAVEKEWKATTGHRMEVLAGPFVLVSSVAFTLSDRPSTFANFSLYLSPWLDIPALSRKGIAILCPSDDQFCVHGTRDGAGLMRPIARRVEVELTPRWLWLSGEPRRFVIAILPPR